MLDLINVKLLEKNIGGSLCGLGLGKDFLTITKRIFKKTNKLNFVNTKKTLCLFKRLSKLCGENI